MSPMDKLQAELSRTEDALTTAANLAGDAMRAVIEGEKAARQAAFALASMGPDVKPADHAKLRSAAAFADDRLPALRRTRDEAMAVVDRLAAAKARLTAEVEQAHFHAACVAPVVSLEHDIAVHEKAIEKLRAQQAALFAQHVPQHNARVAPHWRRSWPRGLEIGGPLAFPTVIGPMFGQFAPHGVYEEVSDILAAHYRPAPAGGEEAA
jgi:hypothetical protein